METPCGLLLQASGSLKLVAYGSVPPTGDRSHSLPIPADHISVSINTALRPYEGLPLPVPKEDAEMFTIQQAKGSFVLWPRAWAKVINEECSISFYIVYEIIASSYSIYNYNTS